MTAARAIRQFRMSAGSLDDRLACIFPELAGRSYELESTPLRGQAWNTLSVRHHRLRLAGGPVHDCVEKALAKTMAVAAYEPLVHTMVADLAAGVRAFQPRHLGIIETPLACFIYSELATGRHPSLTRVSAAMARMLAELELASAAYLRAASLADRLAHWRMDFFHPWTLYRPRYNIGRALLRPALRGDPALAGVLEAARRMRVLLARLAPAVAAAPRCLSHLDVLPKNCIDAAGGLYLIDWGEARVGRIGFDAGSYLHRVLRDSTIPVFEQRQEAFLAAYLAQLPAAIDAAGAGRNALFFLGLRTLCYYLRPEVLRDTAGAPPAIEEKLCYLQDRLERAVGAA